VPQRHPGVKVGYGGEYQDTDAAFADMGRALFIAILAIFAILAAQFRSYTQPLIVMMAIPFGIFGAGIAHLITGYSMSISSMMGIVALSGVVVNHALVMINYANEQRATGSSAVEATHHAGGRRFRPILLTSLTTFFGLAPMIVETSLQARFLIPMAVSLGFGVLAATMIMLLIVPCSYLILEDARRGASNVFARLQGNPTMPPQAAPESA